MKYIKKNKYLMISFFLSFMIILIYSLLSGKRAMLGDAQNYWDLSQTFGGLTNFSFLHYAESFRGYVFPFFLFIMRDFGKFIFHNDYIGFLIINSFMLSCILTVFPKYLFDLKEHKRLVIGGFIITFIFMYFWRSFLLYSLSDLYAFLLFGICVLTLRKFGGGWLYQNRKIPLILISLLLGVCVYSVYNIRTVYAVPLVLLFIVFIWQNRKQIKLKFKKYIVIVILATLGFTAFAIPQSLINYKYNKTYSISVITSKTFGVNLTLQQLYWGVYYQRYETNIEKFVGNPVTYPSPAVKFVDKAGAFIYDKYKDKKMSYMNFISMCLYSPIDTVGIYTRHLVNGMSLLYRDSYIPNMNSNKQIVFILNFIIVALGLIAIVVNRKRFKNIYFLLIIIPAIIAVPGAIENRYLLPVYLILYYSIAYILDIKELKLFIQKNYWAVLIIVILGFALSCSVVSDTLKSAEFGNIKMSTLIFDKERKS